MALQLNEDDSLSLLTQLIEQLVTTSNTAAILQLEAPSIVPETLTTISNLVKMPRATLEDILKIFQLWIHISKPLMPVISNIINKSNTAKKAAEDAIAKSTVAAQESITAQKKLKVAIETLNKVASDVPIVGETLQQAIETLNTTMTEAGKAVANAVIAAELVTSTAITFASINKVIEQMTESQKQQENAQTKVLVRFQELQQSLQNTLHT